jgi:hypothetical protein
MEFHSSFWVNLHHRLHADARPGLARVDTATLPAQPRRAWVAALGYYAANLAPRDLRTGAGMSDLVEALAGSGDTLRDSTLLPALRRVLEAAAPVYQEYYWPRDDSTNRAWIGDVAERLRQIAPVVIPRLASFYRNPWYSEAAPIRIDIVTVGRARGAYTWIDPRPHTVVDAAEPNYQGWLGAEMTLHEASHGVTDSLETMIERTARLAGRDPGQLWHVVQFFVVGEVVRRTLAARGLSFQAYLYATGLFDRSWARWRKPVEQHLRAYLDGTVPLDRALELIIRE